jgi:hypothetical protein
MIKKEEGFIELARVLWKELDFNIHHLDRVRSGPGWAHFSFYQGSYC